MSFHIIYPRMKGGGLGLRSLDWKDYAVFVQQVDWVTKNILCFIVGAPLPVPENPLGEKVRRDNPAQVSVLPQCASVDMNPCCTSLVFPQYAPSARSTASTLADSQGWCQQSADARMHAVHALIVGWQAIELLCSRLRKCCMMCSQRRRT